MFIECLFFGWTLHELIEFKSTITVYNETFVPRPKTIEEKIAITFPEEPELMLAIANCESGFNQEAVSHTRDFGVMQVNERVWDETAKELNLDYKNNADDNLMMARYIYEIQGLDAWVCHDIVAYNY